ncbi:uncharacterized protein LOC134822634 [Bolinopsis microptera]|uniref:uncharacterized protein LOC134822634 n=1 Tax=Bolinopsis microptera TaxID=2820187 RepID=UPI00307A45C4
MAVTRVMLFTLFVALFAPGTANSETEVADSKNVAKAELVKKESDSSPFGTTINRLSIGQVTNYNYAGEASLQKKEPSGKQALQLKKKEEVALKERRRKGNKKGKRRKSGKSGVVQQNTTDGLADLGNDVLALVGRREELETRGRNKGE